MWWTADRRVQRQPIRFTKSIPVRKSMAVESTPNARKRRHLRLPVSVAQAAANLILQESGADYNAEVPGLRKDIRSLESALRHVTRQSSIATCSVESLQNERQGQLETIEQLNQELGVLKSQHERVHLRNSEERAWLTIAVDLASSMGRTTAVLKHDAEQQLSAVMPKLAQLRSDNQHLENKLTAARQENKIFSDVISDMESRHENETYQAQEQLRLLQKRMSQDGATDRSQVQQLNIRIVSQAEEIRSLQKKLAGMQGNVSSEASGFQLILDEQSMTENQADAELNERLEDSLQAARIELDSAVHELKYAQAEAERLRQYAGQIEQQFDSEFHHVVQVAQLHATLAARLEQSRESDENVVPLYAEMHHEEQVIPNQPTIADLIARNNELTHALMVAGQFQEASAATSETIDMQSRELRNVNHELCTLRDRQAELAGENETLSAFNKQLEQRLSELMQRLSATEQKRSEAKAEWEKLLAHHEGGIGVAKAECRLVKSQLEDQRIKFELKLKQQREVIRCLNADVVATRGHQSQLERNLEEETLNRQLAEQEVRQVKREASRLSESLSLESQQSNPAGDEPGGESSVRSAA